MPIRFRCAYCNRLLGIARRKAGTLTTCPHCGYEITVPLAEGPDDDPADPQRDLDDVDALLKSSAPPPAPEPRVERPRPPVPAPAPTPPRPAPAPARRPAPSSNGEPPLFEGDVDLILGATHNPTDRLDEKPKAVPTSGMDAMSLGTGDGQIVLSAQKATALAVAVVVLVIVAFVAGFLMAS